MVRPLSLKELRIGARSPEEVPSTIEHAAALGIVGFVNEHLLFRRAKQIEGITKEPPDVERHYFVPFTPTSFGTAVLNAVIELFRGVGWPHSKIVNNHLVIAREPYDVASGRGGLGADTEQQLHRGSCAAG